MYLSFQVRKGENKEMRTVSSRCSDVLPETQQHDNNNSSLYDLLQK